jgi:ferrous iron transport protein B
MSSAPITVDSPPIRVAVRTIALAGNPNAGKTTLFNALTGMRQKVGNYPGVTVEKKEGRGTLGDGSEVVILDLPGTYSLTPKSPDEEIARDVLLGLRDDTPVPDAVLIVIDASNLERNLYFATQVLELGIPSVIALNMVDVATANGKTVDAAALSEALGTPVVPIVAVRGEGLDELRRVLAGDSTPPAPPSISLPEKLSAARADLARSLDGGDSTSLPAADGIALRLLCGNAPTDLVRHRFGPVVAQTLEGARFGSGVPIAQLGAAETGARYAMLAGVVARAVPRPPREMTRSFSDKADAILTHRVFGLLIFAFITFLVFQAIFSWASIPMDFIEGTIGNLGTFVADRIADGPSGEPGSLEALLVSGIIAGVGAVVVFLPQILILFFFIGLLEDTGYMARAAFLMDRLMSRVGLHGRAFIPLLSSFACAIPGIMAARTISSRRDRMTTILIAPLMTCSARLPVYILMLTTFIPNTYTFGVLSTRALTMFSLYVGGVAAAMAAAWVFKKTLFKGPPPPLMLELPPYKAPAFRNILITMWDRASQFLKRAGTVILAISIVLWFLLSYPKIDPVSLTGPSISPAAGIDPGPGGAPPIVDQPQTGKEEKESTLDDEVKKQRAALQLRQSYAGRIGHVVEPLIAPLGFNWKIGIGLIGAMSAREVFISTMGTVYSVGDTEEDAKPLTEAMRADRWPDGRPVWTTLVAVSLLVYFVLAMQCLSTLAVVRRETDSWKWPVFMQVYMTALAWGASFLVYNIGRAMGWGG